MDDQQKRPPEARGNSSTVFVLLIIAFLALVLFLLLQQKSDHNLHFSDLAKLLEVTKYDKAQDKLIGDEDASTIKVPKKGSDDTFYEFRLPRDLILADRNIEGTVEFRSVGPKLADEEFRRGKFTCSKSPLDATTTQLNELLTQSGVKFRYSDGPSFLQRHGFTIFMMLIILGLFYLMMRKLGGAGGPMQFGRSRGRLMADDDLGVMFSDVAGIDEAVEEVKEVVDFLQRPEKYQKLGGKIPRGVLLVGPPGTGKTRGGSAVGGHDEREQTLNALLVEMDGFASNSGVIVMAATNRPETLDQALMRPGRFDRHVLVDRPDVKGREAILKVHVKSVKLDGDVDLKQVASISPGFAGAELANLVNEAALLAARGECSTVQMKHFNEGVERVTAGLEKKQRVMNQDEKQRVAYHEAGHALVAYSLPNTDPVHKVSIIPRGLAALGYTMQRPADDRYLMTKSELESQLQVLLAGTMAEEMIYNDISTGASNDLERVTDIARGMVMRYGMSSLGRLNFKEDRSSPFLAGASGGLSAREYSDSTAEKIDAEVKRIVDEALEKVRETLKVRKQALVALTERLIEVESVDADELKTIIDENLPGPLLVPGTGAAVRDSDESKEESDESDKAAQ